MVISKQRFSYLLTTLLLAFIISGCGSSTPTPKTPIDPTKKTVSITVLGSGHEKAVCNTYAVSVDFWDSTRSQYIPVPFIKTAAGGVVEIKNVWRDAGRARAIGFATIKKANGKCQNAESYNEVNVSATQLEVDVSANLVLKGTEFDCPCETN